jgi:hypothetical protein
MLRRINTQDRGWKIFSICFTFEMKSISSMNIKRFTPSVDKRVLVILAGLMWCGVGIMLIRFAVTWLYPLELRESTIYYAAGFLAAMPIHHFGFLRIADKNLRRLLPLTEKRCLFSFMTWRSYLIVLVMVSMGIALRHSALPKKYLSILYIGIGLALFLSGIRYLRFFVLLLFKKQV